jgi:CheY-like chemotaxis protein
MMLTVIVDDDAEFAADLESLLKAEGIPTKTFHNVAQARDGMHELDTPFIVLLDHDFGGRGGECGYDLCVWLRSTHTFGLVLPILYLTGREQPAQFIARQRQDPYQHPTAYLAKNELVHAGRLLGLIRLYAQQFAEIRSRAEEQSARQALMMLQQLGAGDED